MKKLSILFFLFVLNLYTYAIPYSTEPQEFVNELVNDAINKLSDKNLTNEEKSKYIEKIALENVDIKALGLYTLGELRKSSEKKDLINYQIAFEKYFLKSLTSRLSDYSSSKFEVTDFEKKSVNYTIVNSKVIYVIDEGKIIAKGNHSNLLNTSDVYKNFYNKQLRKV